MKDLNTAIFLLVIGIVLLIGGIVAPIYSIEIRWLFGILSVASFYSSYAMYSARGRSREDNMIQS
ncbi:hypothetical protein [Rummeliibacillus pycnus]|uniref:hypothetical protein n=1 Tax=Rummeliibacillus pycnus TaxID=101070 RepID=UPI000C9C9EB1|nr:hypothetical protein [Rummeliibacillus pycnus]